MKGRAFIDTNVLVYLFDAGSRAKQRVAQATLRRLLDSGDAALSYQVVQEFVNVALRKFQEPLSAHEIQAFLDRILWPICEVFPSPALYSEALSIAEETGWGFYDSLILASAAQTGCRLLLTEDLQAGRVIRGVEIQNPFA